MITIINSYDGNDIDKRRQEIMCLSSDTKPTNVGNGSVCLEINTGKVFIYNETGSAWVEQ